MASDKAAQLEEDLVIAKQLPIANPKDPDYVNAGRLLMRYPSAQDGQFGAEVRLIVLARLNNWNMELRELFEISREIWANGYRPAHLHEA